MSTRALVEVDSRIAEIQREVADGHGSQIAQVEICELVGERSKLITNIVQQRGAECAPSQSIHAAKNIENSR